METYQRIINLRSLVSDELTDKYDIGSKLINISIKATGFLKQRGFSADGPWDRIQRLSMNQRQPNNFIEGCETFCLPEYDAITHLLYVFSGEGVQPGETAPLSYLGLGVQGSDLEKLRTLLKEIGDEITSPVPVESLYIDPSFLDDDESKWLGPSKDKTN